MVMPGRMTRRELYQTVTRQLSRAGVETPEQEAAFLLEGKTGLPLPRYLMDSSLPAETSLQAEVLALAERRCAGEPLQYLLGEWEFYGLSVAVGEGVLIPRQDTETLVDVVRELRRGCPETRLLDLCSGSGCIPAAVSRYLPHVNGYAVERSEGAFPYLTENLSRHAPQIQAVSGDVLCPELADTFRGMDVITCNPPYLTAEEMQQLQKEVSFEPAMALDGGADGLDFYRQITAIWSAALRPGGWLVYEIGMGQEQAVAAILRENGFSEVRMQPDAAGKLRVVFAAFC